jgi:hypothetical protein
MVAVRPERRGRERLLVASGGMAGLKLVEELTELCPRCYEIVMVGKEPRPPYNPRSALQSAGRRGSGGRRRAALTLVVCR